MMKLYSIVLICFCPIVYSMVLTGSSFKPCDQAAGKIQSVSVEPCESEPCTVSNGDSVDISTKFITGNITFHN
ncbi:hypothetical protein BLOT_007269 [Blomia tropicalis]|nr:hypothetical protein BLOT_007269 [Blomia tropicalis]